VPLRPPAAIRLAHAACLALAALGGPSARAWDGVVFEPPPTATAAPSPETPTAVAPASPEALRGLPIGEVTVDARDCFEIAPGEDDAFGEIVNLLHVTTWDFVIRQHLLLEEGDPLSPERLAESERNLRALRYLRRADVRAVPGRASGTADVHVSTSDRFTTRLSFGLGTVGGVSGGRVDAGESNLLGLGTYVSFNHIERTDRTITRFIASQENIAGSRVDAGGIVSFSDLGELYSGQVQRPFYERLTPAAGGVTGAFEESEIEYFRGGDEVASLPLVAERLGAWGGIGFGPHELVKRLLLEVEWDRRAFDAPEGPESLAVRWPRDRTTLEARLAGVLDAAASFLKVRQLDAFDIVEDVPVGVRLEVGLGAQWRDPEGERGRLEPVSEGGIRGATALPGRQILSVGGRWRLRLGDPSLRERRLGAFAHHYVGLPWQTLASALDFTLAEERDDAPAQLTLGEDSGLRGYPARLLEGTRRLRLTVEDRIHTPLELLSFHFGFVVFCDAGWVFDARGRPDPRDIRVGVGVGIRIFSPELLKERPFRIDLGIALNDDGDGDGFSIALTTDQVFTLFERQDSLGARF
jgi:hypothetical protein